MSSVLKYVGEQGHEHGGQLFWPGAASGFPMRGFNAPTLTQAEYEEVEVQHDFHSSEFDCSDPEQKASYDSVMDRVVNGWYVLHYKEPPSRDPVTGRRVAWLEWSQRYGCLSPAVAAKASGLSSILKAG